MQQPTLQQQIREYEANMPPEILNIIKSFDWRRELRSIVTQNQVMIDVGADLEESVYLMILGIVTVEDVYERLIETHEYSEDKSKKILEEIEVRIFNQLSKKLQDLDENDTPKKESIVNQAYNSSTNPKEVTIQNDELDSRDSILAEIEKEPEPTFQPKSSSNIPVVAPIEISSQGEMKKSPLSNSFSQDSGVRKPFSMNSTKSSEEIEVLQTQKHPIKPISGIQEDPLDTGFKNPTIMENKKAEDKTNGAQAPIQRVVDPYREPIE